MTADLVLITGLPAAGKTSVSKKLAEQLPRSVYISGDDLRTSIIGGFKNPAESWDEETRRQYFLAFENEAALTRNYISHGFKVIVDDVVHAGDLFQEWRKHFVGINYKPILLFPSKTITLKRNKERDKNIPDKIIRSLYEDFSKEDYTDWIVIDNSELNIEETVAEIKKQLNW